MGSERPNQSTPTLMRIKAGHLMRKTRLTGTVADISMDENGHVGGITLTIGRDTLSFEPAEAPGGEGASDLVAQLKETCGQRDDGRITGNGDVDLLHQDGALKAVVVFVGKDAFGFAPKPLSARAATHVAFMVKDRGSSAAGDYQLPPGFQLAADEPADDDDSDDGGWAPLAQEETPGTITFELHYDKPANDEDPPVDGEAEGDSEDVDPSSAE